MTNNPKTGDVGTPYTPNAVETATDYAAQLAAAVVESNTQGNVAPASSEIIEMFARLSTLQVMPDEPLEPEEFLFSWDSIPFAPIGNVVFLKAPAKAGKTFVLTMFATAFLKQEYCGLYCFANESDKVLMFDTEQSRNDSRKTLCRISKECGTTNRVEVYNLRTQAAEDCLPIIHAAILRGKPKLVIIDGIADLIPGMDYNDLSQASDILKKLQGIAEDNGLLIITAIHQNKNNDNAQGWLGSTLLKKAATEFSIIPEKDSDRRVLCCTANRGRKVPDITFTIENTDDGIGRVYAIPTEQAQAEKQQSTKQAYITKLKGYGIEYPQVYEREEFVRLLQEGKERANENANKRAIENLIARCRTAGAIKCFGQQIITEE